MRARLLGCETDARILARGLAQQVRDAVVGGAYILLRLAVTSNRGSFHKLAYAKGQAEPSLTRISSAFDRGNGVIPPPGKSGLWVLALRHGERIARAFIPSQTGCAMTTARAAGY